MEPSARDHLVQLYRHEHFLIESVSLFAGVGLGKGEAVILVAIPSRLEQVEHQLADQGFDVSGLKRWGQLTLVDAAELLAEFMVDGLPSALLFEARIARLVEAAQCGGRYAKLRAYGEMVNLLWRDNLLAAARLEQLWNEAIQLHRIALLCAYCVDSQDGAEGAFPAALKEAHSQLIPIQACVGSPAADAPDAGA